MWFYFDCAISYNDGTLTSHGSDQFVCSLLQNIIFFFKVLQIKYLMVTERGTSVRDKSTDTDRLITGDVTACLCHNQNYARDLCQA